MPRSTRLSTVNESVFKTLLLSTDRLSLDLMQINLSRLSKAMCIFTSLSIEDAGNVPRTKDVDCIIVSEAMNTESHASICAEFRHQEKHVHIVVESYRRDSHIRLKAICNGADSFLQSPGKGISYIEFIDSILDSTSATFHAGDSEFQKTVTRFLNIWKHEVVATLLIHPQFRSLAQNSESQRLFGNGQSCRCYQKVYSFDHKCNECPMASCQSRAGLFLNELREVSDSGAEPCRVYAVENLELLAIQPRLQTDETLSPVQ